MGYSSRRSDGPPTWFLFLLVVALIFGGYYLLMNLRDYLRTGGLSIAEATAMAIQRESTAVQRQVTIAAELPTSRPSSTPRPACEDFIVIAESGIVRQQATTRSPIAETLPGGTTVCVVGRESGSDGFTWYLLDRNPVTNRIDIGYVRSDIVRPVRPTPTPSNTPPPLPTITPTSSPTATETVIVPTRSQTDAPSATPRASATITPTPTAISVDI